MQESNAIMFSNSSDSPRISGCSFADHHAHGDRIEVSQKVEKQRFREVVRSTVGGWVGWP